MNRNHRLIKMDLQRFAPEETNTMTTADLAPAISVDFTSRLAENIRTLQEILGIVEMEPVAAGTTIKFYTETVTLAQQVGEGEVIGLSKVVRTLAGTKELVLEKYRKKVTAETIQKFGQDRAINRTDSALVAEVRKQVKVDFFTNIESATGTADPGSDLQVALANVWGAMQHKFEDKDVTPIFFISSDDVADYLGSHTVTVQEQFGFRYIENFLGLGTTFINPGIAKGAVYGTAVENLNGAYVPATGGDLARAFNLTTDQSGLVGMTHTIDSETASIITLLFLGVIFYAEDLSGVIKATIIGATETTYTAVENPTGNPAQQGWYELVNGEYVLTEDTTVTSGKTYYIASV